MKTVHRVTVGCAAVLLAVLAASCSSTAEGPTIEIRDSSWTAVPETLEAGGGSFSIRLVNLGTTRQAFAVVTLFGGDPGTLPIRDGLLDVSRDGISADPDNPEIALFGVGHPDYERREGGGILVPDTIEPGEEKSITIGGLKGGGEAGTYVVVSYTPGRYEAGDYAEFTITDPDS